MKLPGNAKGPSAADYAICLRNLSELMVKITSAMARSTTAWRQRSACPVPRRITPQAASIGQEGKPL
jgi:hypothetical protein